MTWIRHINVCEVKNETKHPDPNLLSQSGSARCALPINPVSPLWCWGSVAGKNRQGTHLVCGATPPSRSPRPSCWTEEDGQRLRGSAVAPKPTISLAWARSLFLKVTCRSTEQNAHERQPNSRSGRCDAMRLQSDWILYYSHANTPLGWSLYGGGETMIIFSIIIYNNYWWKWWCLSRPRSHQSSSIQLVSKQSLSYTQVPCCVHWLRLTPVIPPTATNELTNVNSFFFIYRHSSG